MSDAPQLLSFAKVASLASAPQWRLTFSQPVTGVRTQDVAFSGDGVYWTGAVITSLVPEGDGTSWLLTVAPGAGEGKIIPSFTGSAVQDVDGLLMPGRLAQSLSFPSGGNVPLVVLDANGDGRLDIATGNSLRLGLGNGTFGNATTLSGGQTGGVPLVIDGNGDGRNDLVIDGGTGDSFLTGIAGGGFASGTPIDLAGEPSSPNRADLRHLLAADINGDGRQDVVAVAFLGAVRVALQLPGGGFAVAVTTPIVPSNALFTPQIALGDINGDGRSDLVSIDTALGGARLWLGQADGTLAASGSTSLGINSTGITLADLNSDGKLDLLTWGRTVSVRLGDGTGSFGERIESNTAISSVSTIPYGPFQPFEVAREVPVQVVKDVTGDGIPDLIGISHQSMFFFGNYYLDEAFIIPGLGNGSFGTPMSLGNQTSGLGDFRAYGDFDLDGRDDFLTSNLPLFVGSGETRTPSWGVSLNQVAPVYSTAASFYTPPNLLSITTTTPNAVLQKGDQAVFVLRFDREVYFDFGAFLRLSNGGVATLSGANGNDQLFAYRAVEGEASGNLEVLGITGATSVLASGLFADLSQPPAVPGNLQVATRNPIYFANADGRLAAWSLDGLDVFDKVLLSYTRGGPSAAAVIHANGADALFYNSGQLASLSSTSPPAGASSIGTVSDKWSFVGEGGSGGLSGRVFWHSDRGEVVFWDTSGSSSSPRAWLGQASPDWRIAAIADTTGDGAADVIFQNQDGRVALWQVQGNAVTRQAVIDTVTPDWELVAAGDLNGDGRADLLYRNSADNRLVARFLDGFVGIGDNQVIGVASTDWSIADLRDMNGDGREDILWRNTSGDFAVWTMDGTQILEQRLFDKLSPDWQLLT